MEVYIQVEMDMFGVCLQRCKQFAACRPSQNNRSENSEMEKRREVQRVHRISPLGAQTRWGLPLISSHSISHLSVSHPLPSNQQMSTQSWEQRETGVSLWAWHRNNIHLQDLHTVLKNQIAAQKRQAFREFSECSHQRYGCEGEFVAIVNACLRHTAGERSLK